MRIIKFRAYDKYNNKMLELGDLEEIAMRKTAGRDDDFANMEIMQYTGLLDKNGKEIYEGDILKFLVRYPLDFQNNNPLKKYGRVTGPVTWKDGWLYVGPEKDGKEDELLYKNVAIDWEVIGNVYESSELINK